METFDICIDGLHSNGEGLRTYSGDSYNAQCGNNWRNNDDTNLRFKVELAIKYDF